MLAELQSWTIRRWLVAAAAAMIVILLVGLPTDVIPNPVFGRPVAVTWWSYPVLVVTGMLGALLAATYVRDDRFIAADELTMSISELPALAALVGSYRSSRSDALCATSSCSSHWVPSAPDAGSSPSSRCWQSGQSC